jgi:hypothetical protein
MNQMQRCSAIGHAVGPRMAGWICRDHTKRSRGMGHRSPDSRFGVMSLREISSAAGMGDS